MNKFRQCPYCKSKKGFKIYYIIKGFGYEERNFKGVVREAERNGADDNDDAECLNCGKALDIERLEL